MGRRSPSYPQVGVLNVSGGTVTMTNAGASITMGGYLNNAMGLLNIAQGGIVNLGTNGIYINEAYYPAYSQADIITVASGGILKYGGFTRSTAQALMNLNGGTLQATTNSTTFLSGLSSMNLGPNANTINNGGFNITIDQDLSGSNGTGIGSISIVNGGSGYIGAPAVQLSGGGGTGATAIAQIDTNPVSATYGKVTNIQVTAPGTGYTSAPTITLYGGGYLTEASGLTAITTNFTSGGLIYAGAGTTTLTGSNTYTGGTMIQTNSSVLVTTSPSPFGTGSLTDNGQLIFSNNLTFTVGGLAGSGSLTQAGTGTLILGGSNSYNGTTLKIGRAHV